MTVINILSDLRLYITWLIILVVALILAYILDPYIYGYTLLIMGVISIVISFCGIFISFFPRVKEMMQKRNKIVLVSLFIISITLVAWFILKAIPWG
jgi:hypothetical protein